MLAWGDTLAPGRRKTKGEKSHKKQAVQISAITNTNAVHDTQRSGEHGTINTSHPHGLTDTRGLIWTLSLKMRARELTSQR